MCFVWLYGDCGEAVFVVGGVEKRKVYLFSVDYRKTESFACFRGLDVVK